MYELSDLLRSPNFRQLFGILRWDTLPETNVAPKNGGFPTGISFSRGLFSDANC